ncbi:MAG: L-malyl-CoA/beta-methylmalyl-CoA lyase [Frankiales bacterium]|nr:L-malyl-CoA/beta-methylmalyl-CoA lyase [Frankiales bacterium]
MTRPTRSRRSCLAVPGSNEKMLKKAQGLEVDQVFLDLEDSVAPLEKPAARQKVVAALRDGDWLAPTRVVRINDVDTPWALQDVTEVVLGAGDVLDCIMLPKAESARDVQWLDLTLTLLERQLGLAEGSIGIEAQIEGPRGLRSIDAIAGASERLETLIFGPGDFMANMKIPSLTIGVVNPYADPFESVLMTILSAARAHGLQAIDGPFPKVHDSDSYRTMARKAWALGYDGKWVLHPKQIDVAHEVFTPAQGDYDRSELILDAYAYYTSAAGGAVGAAMLGDEMIDEASRKLAFATAFKGRTAGMVRSAASAFSAP